MKKKKIFFLIESFIVGGAEKVLIDIVNNLDANKYDITVCSVFKYSIYKGYNNTFEKPFNANIKYRYLINNKLRWLYIIFNFLLVRIPNILFHLLIGEKYDIVIAFYEGLPTSWIARVHLKKGEKIAWLHTSTQLSQQGRNEKELNRQLKYYNQYKRIVAVSQGVADSFTNLFNQKNKIIVIYNPINNHSIIEKSKSSIPIKKTIHPTFVSVGRMAEVKGYDRWLRILLKLKEKGYDFQSWIIGGGNREKYEIFVKDNQLSNYVIFLGHQDNPYSYMAKADWIVCPSILEGLSTVVLEGITLGKAIVATDCPGMKELLGDSQYGIVCGNNEDSIKNTIENIICTPNLQTQYESTIINQKYKFNIENSIYQIETLLDA